MELSPLTFGERIRVCRRRVGLSQQKLASLIGVHESTICRWERDQHTLEMTLKNFMKIAEVTKTSAADFFTPLPEKRGAFEIK